MVQLHDAEGGDVLPLSVEQLLQESDGVLQGVLTYDRRRGEAAPALRVQQLQARLSPSRGKGLRAA
eukprot:2106296-Pleurochrysis_carterae.AAC.1